MAATQLLEPLTTASIAARNHLGAQDATTTRPPWTSDQGLTPPTKNIAGPLLTSDTTKTEVPMPTARDDGPRSACDTPVATHSLVADPLDPRNGFGPPDSIAGALSALGTAEFMVPTPTTRDDSPDQLATPPTPLAPLSPTPPDFRNVVGPVASESRPPEARRALIVSESRTPRAHRNPLWTYHWDQHLARRGAAPCRGANVRGQPHVR
jgi:hypothetical protein